MIHRIVGRLLYERRLRLKWPTQKKKTKKNLRIERPSIRINFSLDDISFHIEVSSSFTLLFFPVRRIRSEPQI